MSVTRETPEQRKALPIATGVLDYFPDALLAVAEVSRVGNEQHNPGQPVHWAKEKSTDEADALLRHLIDRGTRDTDGMRHSAKVAWRALAMLQRELDAEADALPVKVVAFSDGVLESIAETVGVEMEWGEPNPDGSYTPTFTIPATPNEVFEVERGDFRFIERDGVTYAPVCLIPGCPCDGQHSDSSKDFNAPDLGGEG